MKKELIDKYRMLLEILNQYDSALIAYSGGVDSSFLLHAADESRIKRLFAVSIKSDLLADSEILDVRKNSAGTRAELVVFEEDILAVENVKSNPPDRCYYCKKTVLGIMKKFAEEKQISVIIEGTNAEDLKDHRPGYKAVTEEGVVSPLLLAGITKTEIREIAQEKGWQFFKKKSSPCFATRIAHNEELTREKLKAVMEAEKYLSGFIEGNIRVRVHGDIARIETDRENFNKLVQNDISADVVKKFESLGFKFVALDLTGYKMGSMNHIPEDNI